MGFDPPLSPPPAEPRLTVMTSPVASRIAQLSDRSGEFINFLTAQLHGSRAEAEDVLQHSLLKALAAAPNLRDEERLVSWFYQVLRNAVVDHTRARRATRARETRWADETLPNVPTSPEAEKQLCQCLAVIAASLPPRSRILIQRVDLGGEPVLLVALDLGLTPNAAHVALHRARALLRKKLETFCGECAQGACLDCDCDRSSGS